MKRISTLLFLVLAFSIKLLSQNCTVLGCVGNYGVIRPNSSEVQDQSGILGGCYGQIDPGPPAQYAGFTHVYWEFFYSGTGGNFEQAFTPVVNTSDPNYMPDNADLDIDYILYQFIDAPAPTLANMTCPINPELNGWSQIYCDNMYTGGIPTGPGHNTTFTTIPNTYYAIAIVFYQTSGNYSFTVGTPTIDRGTGAESLTASNCINITPISPIKLLSFNAKVINCAVNLDWTAKDEFNLKNYEIQSSGDGISFQKIATVNPSLLMESLNSYLYEDTHPVQGNQYYRLKMTDKNENFKYSDTLTVNINCAEKSISIYPNPVNDILKIFVTKLLDDATTFKLFDMNGKLIHSGKLIIGANSINMAKFGKGVYLLKVTNKFQIQYFKIVK
jgi:hypothetical protein